MRSFHPKEKIIAEYIVSEPLAAKGLTITELSAKLGVSQGLIVKFCQHVGFGGFKELKQILLKADETRLDGEVTEQDNPQDVFEKVLHNSIMTLEDTRETLDREMFARAARSLIDAPQIAIYGKGGSSRLAEATCRKFMRMGSNISFHTHDLQQALSASSLNGGCVAIGISYSGETLGIVESIRIAKEHGATTIAITNYKYSALAKTAEIPLIAASRGIEMYQENEHGKLAQAAIVDGLYFYYLNNSKNDFHQRGEFR